MRDTSHGDDRHGGSPPGFPEPASRPDAACGRKSPRLSRNERRNCVTRRMLINAQNREELRVAIVDGSTLENFQVEVAETGLLRGNIYRAVVSNVQPSLNAAFVDYGEERA